MPRLAKLVYKLHDQRAKLEPSVELRRKYLLATFAAQVQSEKDAVRSHLERMSPGIRRSIQLPNTPEISQFRGYQESLDDDERRRHVMRVEREELHHTARETQNSNADPHPAAAAPA